MARLAGSPASSSSSGTGGRAYAAGTVAIYNERRLRNTDYKGGTLEATIKQQQSIVDGLGEQLETIAKETPISAMGMSEKYYKVLRQYQQERKKLNDFLDKKSEAERSKRRTLQSTEKKRFVNSFGEAAKREITSSTYKRAMRRQEKEILRFLWK